MRYHPRTMIACCIAFFTAASVSAQGLYWESVITREGKSDTSLSRSYYMPKMFKEKGSYGDGYIIVRLDKKLFIMVDDRKKEYSEMTFDEMEGAMKKVGGAMSGAMAEMEKQMANLTPEQQKMMKEMMGDRMPGMKSGAKVEVSQTGEKKNISGFSCVKNVVKRGGEDFMALWTTKEVKGVESMGEEMKEFGKRMAAMNPMGDQSESEAMMNVEGFPIRTDIAGVTTVVTRLEEKSVPAEEFEVPAGYKKVKSDMLEKMEDLD